MSFPERLKFCVREKVISFLFYNILQASGYDSVVEDRSVGDGSSVSSSMDGSVGDVAFFRMKYPINPEIKEAARMEIFASVRNSGSENASTDIKMDMVNPERKSVV